MKIDDLEFQCDISIAQNVMGGFKAAAFASVFAAGNRFSFVRVGTFTFENSGSFNL